MRDAGQPSQIRSTPPPGPQLRPAYKGQCSFNYFSHTPGVGLRYHTPVGPIRLDFSYNLNPPVYPVTYNYSQSDPTPPHVGEASTSTFSSAWGRPFDAQLARQSGVDRATARQSALGSRPCASPLGSWRCSCCGRWLKHRRPGLAAGAAVVLDRVVAVVNNHAILASDLDDEIRLSILDPNHVGMGRSRASAPWSS